MKTAEISIERISTSVYTIPTDAPESDGTLAWDRTTMVVVEIEGGGETGLGYTYASASAAPLIEHVLAQELAQCDAHATGSAWDKMNRRVRNIGRPGIAACAISALDLALWDLKAKCLGISVARLLGPVRESIPAYGSGGFTNYSDTQLAEQLSGWAAEGCAWVKMKVGREPARDSARVRCARQSIGQTILFVDANGAFAAKQALAMAQVFSEHEVEWFEEPVSSDDLEGLHFVRERAPAGMDIAAGEYGYSPWYFRRMLGAKAVDVLQADITRCGGITGFLRAAALCDGFMVPLSCHCAPAAHLHAACAAPRLRHLEWFHDHVRIERMLFDGAPVLADGRVAPDFSRPGLGIALKRADAAKFQAKS